MSILTSEGIVEVQRDNMGLMRRDGLEQSRGDVRGLLTIVSFSVGPFRDFPHPSRMPQTLDLIPIEFVALFNTDLFSGSNVASANGGILQRCNKCLMFSIDSIILAYCLPLVDGP